MSDENIDGRGEDRTGYDISIVHTTDEATQRTEESASSGMAVSQQPDESIDGQYRIWAVA